MCGEVLAGHYVQARGPAGGAHPAQQRVRGAGEGRRKLAAGGLPADSDLDVRIVTIWQ